MIRGISWDHDIFDTYYNVPLASITMTHHSIAGVLLSKSAQKYIMLYVLLMNNEYTRPMIKSENVPLNLSVYGTNIYYANDNLARVTQALNV